MQRTRNECKSLLYNHYGIKEDVYPQHLFEYAIKMVTEYDPSVFCSKCHNTGNTITNYGSYLIINDCLCRLIYNRKRSIKNAIDEANIPDKYKKFTISDWINPGTNKEEVEHNKKTYNIIHKYCENIDKMRKNGYGLFLCGPNGVGKTLLACAIGNVAIESGYTTKYFTMSRVIRTVIDGWFREGEAKKIADSIDDAEFLIVDDIDKVYETKTGIQKNIFDNLFRDRLQNNMPTICTSNITLDQVEKKYGKSVYSMFLEHCAELVLLGKDQRQKLSDDIIKDILG